MSKNSLHKDLVSQKNETILDDRSAHPQSSLAALDMKDINKTIIEEELSEPSNHSVRQFLLGLQDDEDGKSDEVVSID